MIYLKLIVTCGLTTVCLFGCATQNQWARAPAAVARITADEGSQGRTDLEVEVKHLAQPEKVASGATDYVIWLQPQGVQEFQNIGVLEINDAQEGEYKITIPHKKFRVVVTPELARNVTRPTGPIVFDQIISR